ncbi:MAG: PAS domain-containing protein, partial [Desulfohalobiaceae bacterium]
MVKATPSTVTRLKVLLGIIEGTSDGAMIIDPDGKILAINSILADQIGIPRGELTGCCLWDVLPEAVAARRMVVYEMAVNSKTSIHYEDDSRPGFIYDTRLHPVLDEQGEVSDVVVFITDITKSRQVEKDRLRLRAAIEHAVEAFVITDENLVIQYVNQTVA